MVPEGQDGGHKREDFFSICILERILIWNIWPVSIKLGTNISCMMGIYSNEGPSPLQRGNHKSAKSQKCKNRVGSFKCLLLMNHSAIKAQIYTSASWYKAESILFNSWLWGKTYLHLLQWGKSLKISSRNHWAKKVQIYLQGDLMAMMKSNFACVYMRNSSQYDSGERCGLWASCYLAWTFLRYEWLQF
jgi:hypothetical protein